MRERILASLVLLFLAVDACRLIKIEGRSLRLRHGEVWALAALGGIGAALFAKSIDGLGRKLASFGLSIDSAFESRLGFLEEVIGLGLPVLFLIAIILVFRPTRPVAVLKLARRMSPRIDRTEPRRHSVHSPVAVGPLAHPCAHDRQNG